MAGCCTQRRHAGKRRAVTVVLTTVLLGGILAAVRLSDSASSTAAPPAGDDPAQRVAAMIAAEKSGDVAGYLQCFSGVLRESLEARMAAESSERGGQTLRRRAADLMGHAVTKTTFAADESATLVLERVYKDRNERHELDLRRAGDTWYIAKMTPLESYAPEIPYGTPVAPLSQE